MRRGARVLVTSVASEASPDTIDLLAADASGTWRLRTRRLPIAANGAGDAIAALFLHHVLRTGSTPRALEAAASSVFGLLRRTAEVGSRELLLIAAQEEFVQPSETFPAEPV